MTVKEEKTNTTAESKEIPKMASATEDTETAVKKEEAATPIKQEQGATTNDSKKPAMSQEETLKNVTERLTFFFSDANVRQDPFIRRLLLSPDKAVGIDQLLKFNTIKQYTTDPAVVRKAAEQLSEVLTVKDNNAIGRVKEFTRDLMDKNVPVSLLVGNLPFKKEEDGRHRYSVTVDDLKAMFDGYGPLALIKLRFGFEQAPDDDLLGSPPPHRQRRIKGPRLPLGSALVEFETAEALEKAAAETLTTKDGVTVEPQRKLTFDDDDSVFTVVTLKEHLGKISKKRKAHEQEGNAHEDHAPEEEELPKFTVDWKSGCVIKLEGLAESCDREQILEAMAKALDKDVDSIKEMKIYADYSRGQTQGCIRFLAPEPVADILQKLQSGDLQVAGAKVEKAYTLQGEEEKQYWNDFMEFKTKQLRQRGEERRRSGGGHRHRNKHRRHSK